MIGRAALVSLLLSTAIGLSGCGASYISSRVTEDAEGFDVQVVALTPQTVQLANSAPYAPRSLPEEFYLASGGGNLRGTGALPEAPEVPQLSPRAVPLSLPPAADPGPYLLGTGDVLRLSIASGQPVDLATGATDSRTTLQEITVRDSGIISIPSVGLVTVGGMTIDDAEAVVFQSMIQAGIDPNFSLEVAAFNSQRVTVGGAVARATIVPVTLTDLTLNDALTSAGGLTVDNPEYASIRLYRDGTLYQIPLQTYFERGAIQSLRLLSGDAVYVDVSYDLDRALAFYQSQIDVIAVRRADRTAALAELQTEIGLRRAALAETRETFLARSELGASERDYVYLAGEVATQSRWPLPYGQQASLADVLFDNGGFDSETGNPSQIYVLRLSADPANLGAVTAWHLDATNAIALTLAPRFEMRPDDIVFIDQQPITRWDRAIRQTIPSLLGTIANVAN